MSLNIRIPFKGTVQAQGFNPATVPDLTGQLERNRSVGDRNAKRAYDMAQAYSKQMQTAKSQREEIESKMQLEELGQFSKTLQGLIGDAATLYIEDQKAKARVEASKDFSQFQQNFINQKQLETEARQQNLESSEKAATAAENGYSYVFSHALKNDDGSWKNYEYNKSLIELHMQNAGSVIPQILSQQGVNESTPIPEFAGRLEEAIQEYTKDFGDLSDGFRAVAVDKYIFPLRQKLLNQHQKLHSRDLSARDQESLIGLFFAGQKNLQEFFAEAKSLEDLSKTDGSKLSRTGAHKLLDRVIKEGIDTGRFNRDILINLYRSSMTDEGKSWAESNFTRNRLDKQLLYLEDKLRKDAKQVFGDLDIAFQQNEIDLADRYAGSTPTEQQIATEQSKVITKYGRKSPYLDMLSAGYSLDDQQRKAYRTALENAVLTDLINPDFVSSIPDYKLQQEFMPLAIQAVQKKQAARYKDKIKALTGEVKTMLNIGPDDFITNHGDKVLHAVISAFDAKYIELKSSGEYTDNGAAEAAADYATDLLKSNKGRFTFQPSAPFKFPKIDGDKATKNSAEAKAIRVSEEMSYIRKLGPNDVLKKGSIVRSKDEMIDILSQFSKNGKILHPGIRYYASLYDENPLFVLQSQANAYEIDVKFPEPKTLPVGDNRRLQSDNLTSTQKTRILRKNGILPATYRTPASARTIFSDMMDGIRGVESRSDPEAMYPSTRLAGATKMTISEVAARATGAVGLDQHMPRFLEQRARMAGLDPKTALFNEENQERLALVTIQEKLRAYNLSTDVFRTNPRLALRLVSEIWAAVPRDERGVTSYPGNNKAHMTYEEAMRLIQSVGMALSNSLI